jgi:hypothetical protein
MPRETITFRMEGEDIPIKDFADTMGHLRELIRTLSQELGHGRRVHWIIQDLQASSAEITLHGTSKDLVLVDEFSDAFVRVGHALATSRPLPYSKSVRDAAEKLASVINGTVRSLVFETDNDSVVVGSASLLPPARRIYALGELQGVVETLTKRRQRRFVLYDSLFNRKVDCYFTSQYDEKVREAWDNQVVVTGRIGRDSLDGHPIEIRDIQDIRIIQEAEPFDYNRAFGIIDLGEEPPENLVRRLRDAD